MKLFICVDKLTISPDGINQKELVKGDSVDVHNALGIDLLESGKASLEYQDITPLAKNAYFRVYYGGGKHKIVYGNPDTKEGEDYAPHGTVIYFDDKEKANEAAASLNAEQDK